MKAPISNLIEATVTGLVFSTLILIAIKADPQIALKTINKKKLLDKIFCFKKNYLLFFGEGRVILS